MELAAGIVVADRFRLVRQLGEGGMGAVWLAEHTGLDISCAVKFIHEKASQAASTRARFEREAKAAAQLRSPYVVQILDHGVWEGLPYIAMEYLDGEDLAQRLHRAGTLTAQETLAIAVQVGRALSKAHAAGLVHRDLKPPNIFLVRDDDHEIAKVLDFGIAKVKETGIEVTTKTGAVLGTPYYMSPEQARGSKSIDHRADLWALAIVVYECLLGKLPFTGEALGDLFVKICAEPLPVPSEEAAGVTVPPGFDAWWARAVSRDPEKRFQSAKELTDALALALGVTMIEGLQIGAPIAGPAITHREGAAVELAETRPSDPAGKRAAAPTEARTGAATPSALARPGEKRANTLTPSGVVSVSSLIPSGGSTPPPEPPSASTPPPPPRTGRGGLIAGVAAVAALGALGAFFALRGGPATPPSAGVTAALTGGALTPAAPAITTVAPAATPAAPAVTVEPATSAAAPPSAGATSAAASSVPASSPAASAKVPHGKGPKAKTDFGF